MIEINNQQIGDYKHKTFTLLNDGFIPSGWVQMECRLSDMDSEGEAFFISVFDEDVCKNGNYSPLEMDKQELKTFIDYLNECYNQLP